MNSKDCHRNAGMSYYNLRLDNGTVLESLRKKSQESTSVLFLVLFVLFSYFDISLLFYEGMVYLLMVHWYVTGSVVIDHLRICGIVSRTSYEIHTNLFQ